jgi:hypothetical protein
VGVVTWRTSFLAGLIELRVLVFEVKTLGLTLMVVPDNDDSLVISVLKALFEYWTFSRVKT